MSKIRKCLAAGITAGVAAIAQAVNTHGEVTSSDWLIVAIAVIGAGYVTWQIPNAPAEPNGH